MRSRPLRLARRRGGVGDLQVRERPPQLARKVSLEMRREIAERVDRLLRLRQILPFELREREARERGGGRDEEVLDGERGELLLERLDVDVGWLLVSHRIAIRRAPPPRLARRRSPAGSRPPRTVRSAVPPHSAPAQRGTAQRRARPRPERPTRAAPRSSAAREPARRARSRS